MKRSHPILILAPVLALFLAPGSLAVPVTFQLNVSVQKALGAFDPAADTVTAAGTFNSWNTTALVLTPSTANADIYTGTVDDTADTVGGNVQYKFIITRGGTANWESINNRTFALASSAQTLDPVYFNDQSQPPGTVAITFQVNMKVQTELGHFDPANDSVVCAGTFNGWSTATFVLEKSSTDTNVYFGTFVDSNDGPGSQVQYKFVINGATTGLTWESIDNRVMTLPATDATLPIVYFSNLDHNPGAGTLVTFQLDLSAQVALGSFDPDSGTASVAGAFNSWSTTASPLTNSPTKPYLFTGTFSNATDAPGNAAQFKFVLNGGNWETGNNRSYTLASTAQTLDGLFFNNVGDLGPLAFTVTGNELTVTWTAAPRARLQQATTLTNPSWIDVPGSEGSDTATLPIGTGQAYFRLIGP